MRKHTFYNIAFILLFLSCKGQDNKTIYNFELEDSDESYTMDDWSVSKKEHYYNNVGHLITATYDTYKVPNKTTFSTVVNSTLNIDVDYNKTFQIAPKKIIDDYEINIIVFPKSRIVALSNELPLLDSVSVKHYKSRDYKNLDHSSDNNLILNKVFFEDEFNDKKAVQIINLLTKNNIELYGNAHFSKVVDLNKDGIKDSIFLLKNKLSLNINDYYSSKMVLKKGTSKSHENWLENKNLIFDAPENCFSEGFQNIVFKYGYFTIEQSFCNENLVYSYTTFKYHKSKDLFYLHKYGEEYIQGDDEKAIPSKIWTIKDFGLQNFEDISKDFFKKLRQKKPI